MLGTETLDALAHTKVAVFGLGGVGSWCAESLVRSGIGKLLLVDSDRRPRDRSRSTSSQDG